MNQHLLSCVCALGIPAVLVAFDTKHGMEEGVRALLRALFEGVGGGGARAFR